MIARLSPLVLQELGLIAAIRKEAKDLAKSTGIKARVAVGDELGRFNPEAEAAIYRVVQEALHNSSRHAEAKLVRVTVREDPGQILLSVQDDGKGFQLEQERGMGLLGIEERVTNLGGHFRVESEPGHGTLLEVVLPVPAAQTAKVQVTS